MNLQRISLMLLLGIVYINCADDVTSTTASTTSTAAPPPPPTTTMASTTSTTTSTTTTEASKVASTCTLNASSKTEQGFLDKVMALDKKQFTWTDSDHEYYFGVCTKADQAKNVNEAFVQINKKSRNQVVLGRLDDVDLEGFGVESKGIRIQYKHGDKYPHVCNKAERNAVVYIVCNPVNSSDIFEMIEENHDREGDTCSYIFQLRTPLMCSNSTASCSNSTSLPIIPGAKTASRLGFMGIILLVALTVVILYFGVGVTYKRYVEQARGVEQLPHHEIWQTIGVRSSDCCTYICRCGKTPSQIRNYEHISDQLSDDDENLLNM